MDAPEKTSRAMQSALRPLTASLRMLDDAESVASRQAWWSATFPGIPESTPIAGALDQAYPRAPRSADAESELLQKRKGPDYVVITPGPHPLFWCSDERPPFFEAICAALRRASGPRRLAWCAVADIALRWTLLEAEDGSYFLRVGELE